MKTHTHTHLTKKIVISLLSMPKFDLREVPVGDDEKATVLLSCEWCIRIASQEKNEGQEWQWRQWWLIVSVSEQKGCALDCVPEGHRVSCDQLVRLIDVFESIDGLSTCKYLLQRSWSLANDRRTRKIDVALQTSTSRLEKILLDSSLATVSRWRVPCATYVRRLWDDSSLTWSVSLNASLWFTLAIICNMSHSFQQLIFSSARFLLADRSSARVCKIDQSDYSGCAHTSEETEWLWMTMYHLSHSLARALYA